MSLTDTSLRDRKRQRGQYIEWASKSVKYQESLKRKCSKDLLFFINNFCWTFDPRAEAKPHHHPFFLYDFQEVFLTDVEESYRNSKDLLVEKSRDMGASWMLLSWIVWHWLFDKTYNALVGSRKEDYVDNREMDSLFGKLDYQIDRLPEWMKPQGWDRAKHRTYMRLSNPENGNSIQGESANPDFSRAGRYAAILLDEYSFWDSAGSVWTATADSAPVRIVVSTPSGMNNKFAELRWPTKETDEKIKVISLHWRLHPKKTEQWYLEEVKRRRPKEIAQELDLNYEASGNEKVYPELVTNGTLRRNVFVKSFEIPTEEKRLQDGKIFNVPIWAMSGGLDYGTRNNTAFHVYARDYDGNHWAIWEWVANMERLLADGWKGSMVQAIADMLKNKCPYYKNIDVIRADPSLWVENQNSPNGMTSIWRQLCDEGITKLAKGAQSDVDCIQLTKSLWSDENAPKFRIFADRCPVQCEEFEGLMWDDWSEAIGHKRDLKEKIVDKDQHSWDDYKYYIMGRPQIPTRESEHIPVSYDQRVKNYMEKRRKHLVRLKKGGYTDPTLGRRW